MRKNKILVLVAVAALLVSLTVVGSIAYLSAQSGPVTNTFTAGELGSIELLEHGVEADAKGKYTLLISGEPVKEAQYIVIPGNDLPKDPYVKVEVSKDLEAYLFVEVIDSLPEELDWEVDGKHWVELTDENDRPILKNDHPIYVYKDSNEKQTFSGPLGQDDTNIIKKQTIVVPENFVVENMEEDATLKFQAYLCQATSFADAAEAWNKCFVSGAE